MDIPELIREASKQPTAEFHVKHSGLLLVSLAAFSGHKQAPQREAEGLARGV